MQPQPTPTQRYSNCAAVAAPMVAAVGNTSPLKKKQLTHSSIRRDCDGASTSRNKKYAPAGRGTPSSPAAKL